MGKEQKEDIVNNDTKPLLSKEVDLAKWKVKRRRCFIVYCILAIFLGIEYSVITPSLWFYLQSIVHKDVKMFYGITLAAYYISAISTSFIITWIADKTRETKLIMLILIALEMIGNIFYCVYFAVLYPLIGRTIQGFGDVNSSIMLGEISRSYKKEEITSKVSTIVMCFSVSFVCAPALNVVFHLIDVDIYGFHLNFGNMPGLLMLVLFTIMFLAVVLFTSNLSKEYDLKRNEIENKVEEEPSCSSKKIKENNKTMKTRNQNPNKLFKYFEFNLLIAVCFLMSFSVVAFFDVAMPIITSKEFGYTSIRTSMLFLAAALLFIIVTQVIKHLSKTYTDYHMLILGLVLFIISTSLLFTFTLINHKFNTLRHVIYIVHILTLGVCWSVEQLLAKSLLTKITPSMHQTYSEGVRRSTSSLACILSSLITTSALGHMWMFSLVVVVIATLFISLLYFRRRLLIKEMQLF